jgi:glutamate synthase domain-containing protein 3
MSNGVAFVLDENGGFLSHVNTDMVRVERCTPQDEADILALIHEHLERTGSPRARQLIGQWETWRLMFKKVVPNSLPGGPAGSAASSVSVPEPSAEPAPANP